MFVREIGVDELNYFVNRPDILPCISSADSVDLSFTQHLPGVALECSGGCMYFVGADDTVWSAHYLFPTGQSGTHRIEAARAMINYVFTTYPISAICGDTPRYNRAARLMNRKLGALPIGRFINEGGTDCIVYRLTREQHERNLRRLEIQSK